jgi:hypothetical protein
LTVVNIASNDAKEIKPNQYLDYKFTLPPTFCSVRGKIEGVTGGQKNFEAFIMNDENFRNWSARLASQSFQSGRKVVWSFDQNVNGSGDWHLVVSNTFSVVTAKAVTISADATREPKL